MIAESQWPVYERVTDTSGTTIDNVSFEMSEHCENLNLSKDIAVYEIAMCASRGTGIGAIGTPWRNYVTLGHGDFDLG